MVRRKRGDGRGSAAMKSLDLESLWPWLPTFRVVAEHESVAAAARLLRLSASSVSRSVRLLEKELGKPLFDRSGRRFELNDEGRKFLEAVRCSMRLVDDATTRVRREEGPFRLSCPRFILPLFALALTRFRDDHPASALHLRDPVGTRELAAGTVDVLVVAEPYGVDAVEAHLLGSIHTGAYVARAHPLAAAPTIDAALEHGWVVAPREMLDDHLWPVEERRLISTDVVDLSQARDACIAGLGPALLPSFLARPAVSSGELVPIAGRSFRPLPIYALRRPRLAADRAESMINFLSAALRPTARS